MSLTSKKRKDIKVDNVRLYNVDGLVAVESEINTSNKFGISEGTQFTIKFIRKPGDNILPIVDVKWYSTTLENYLNKLFFGKDEIMLEIGYKIYYVKVMDSEVTKYRNFDALDITFELLSDCCYSPIMLTSIRVTEEKTVELMNDGIRETDIDLTVQAIEDGDITITNNGKSITIKGLKANERARVYDGNIEGISYYDVEGDIYSCLRLRVGRNRLTVTATNANVLFKYQSELGLS